MLIFDCKDTMIVETERMQKMVWN